MTHAKKQLRLVRVAAPLGWALALLVLGWIGATVGALRCDENLLPGTTRAGVCTALGLSHLGRGSWFLTASAPALLFVVLVIALGYVRARLNLAAGVFLGILIAFDAIVLVLVKS
jgi:hypothetical protein